MNELHHSNTTPVGSTVLSQMGISIQRYDGLFYYGAKFCLRDSE